MQFLIADDHSLLREGLVVALRAAFPAARLAQVDTWAAAHRSIGARHFDLILLDIFMPRRGAWEDELRRLLAALSGTPVCILSASAEPAHIQAAADAGVRAYVVKTVEAAELLDILRRVLAGETVLPQPGRFAPPPPDPDLAMALTRRQREILARLATGASNRDLAGALGLTEATVKRHVHNICRRLGAANRVEAVALARAAGLLRDY
ncbi:response regulator transcription factor [uncultured Thiohalocapsa sp.]|uniref:response regulator transcription factor n=1 Tax=uncultured Thiohalocapsa sp. TaxID=768990 RepID=UPI0025CE83CA|nr:response regulator transcription factor [uncultured Thiohalocapsa sp.]